MAALVPGCRRAGHTYQGFSKALRRWSPQWLLLERHWRTLVQQAAGAAWRRAGFVPLGVDGARVAVPHTADNLRAFGCGGKNPSGPSAWRVMRLHLGVDLPWAGNIAKATAAERGLLRQMLAWLPQAVVRIADAGYTGYEFWQTLDHAGHAFLIRVGANVRLLTKLGYGVREYDGIVYVWPRRQARAGQAPLILRLIVLHDGRKPVYLLTNVFDPRRLSDAQAARCYRLRWHLEVFFRGFKQTLGQRQMRSHAPVQAALELRWSVLALAVIGLWTVQSQGAAGGTPGRSRLAAALRHLRGGLRPPAQTCRRSDTLAARLARALRDPYIRRAPKTSGHWPHKKNDPPPGAPKITPASAAQILAAQQLRLAKAAA